jgi:hypothetical protein
LESFDLEILGLPFVVKPANVTGGGRGVFKDARCVEDVLRIRRENSGDVFLLQEQIVPLVRDGRRFWFRAFFCCDSVLSTWWNEETHVYEVLTAEQCGRYGLDILASIQRKIAGACRLNFFSSEIVLDGQGRYIVVDYVNEVCDLRLQSQAADGVPDDTVLALAQRIAEYIRDRLSEY